jgi:crotonobetainyl-CoA:carnitine CoA-transferase CaiB-like acyl-CoA transferase
VLGYNVDRQAQPVPPAVQVADLGGGTLAAVAILAAVLSRQHSGQGQAVDVSLFGSAIAWLPTLIAGLFSGRGAFSAGAPPLAGGLPHYGVYATADRRHVTLGALEPKFLFNFLERVGRPSWRRWRRRSIAAAAPARRVDRHLRLSDAGHGLADLAEVDTCFAPANTLEETLHDPQVEALGLFTSVAHPRLGPLPQISPPFTLRPRPRVWPPAARPWRAHRRNPRGPGLDLRDASLAARRII